MFSQNILSNPFEGWTNQCSGAYARDEDGNQTVSNSPEACSWCATGILRKRYIDNDQIHVFNKFLASSGKVECKEGNKIAFANDVLDWKPIDFKNAWDECFNLNKS